MTGRLSYGMPETELQDQLRALKRPRGHERRFLTVGDEVIRIDGLDRSLAGRLEERWGGFLLSGTRSEPYCTLQLFKSPERGWLERSPSGERYRLEAVGDADRRVIVSYKFAICSGGDPAVWRVATADSSEESPERSLDNVLRYFTARLAIDRGGFAIHGAGVLNHGRAYLFAGPSRAGKSTAVALTGATSLGDDLALVVPGKTGWVAPALPFDNSERIRHDPPPGLHPVAGIWRLHQARRTRVENPDGSLAVASLLGCTAFPWALPDLADPLLEQVKRFVQQYHFAHLHFSKDADLWTHLA